MLKDLHSEAINNAFSEGQGVTMAQESALQPYQHYNRTDVLDGRVSGQERTLAVLVEQALRIKEEVAASLHATQGSVLAEALSRRLLESHISTITHIVKQLSVDIQALESNITQRDSVTSGTSLAVQSLDQKNMAGIGDLRGRVARCDASISKLSADVRSGEQQTVSLRQEVAELRSALDGRLKEMELKLYQVEGRLEGSLAEQSQGHRRTLSELQSQVKLLEARSSGGLRDSLEEIDSVRKWAEQQLHASEKTNTQGNHVLHTSLQDKLVEAEARLAERLRVVESRAEHSETHQQRSSHGQLERLKRSETKVSGRINSLESSLRQELQLVKQDYQEGFKSVHDAIDSLRQIVDARSRLDKEKLQKDLRHIRRKMVGLGDP